ncbi:MAG: hypothetical protein PHI18_01555 [bacterium]|nr:hypothetical protein [bacterium]
MTAVYEHGIKPLVESMGMQCKRADEIYSSSGILGDIWDSLQTAEIVIADLTGKNPNVMYELGLSHVLWKRVILLSQNKDDVPFDLRAWRVLWYDFTFAGAARLKEELHRAIEALLAEHHTESEVIALSSKPKTVPHPAVNDFVHGIVTAWRPHEKFGFIRAGEEDFYFNQTYLFSSAMEVAEEKSVVFIPQEPLPDAKNRRASRVFVRGSKLRGTVTRVIAGKGYGFAEVVGDRGETQSLLLLIDDAVSITKGSDIECTVAFNDHGPVGENIVVHTK